MKPKWVSLGPKRDAILSDFSLKVTHESQIIMNNNRKRSLAGQLKQQAGYRILKTTKKQIWDHN